MMTKERIQTAESPAAIGTYSQAIKAGNTVYISGQIPLDPKSMALTSEDFADQAQQVFKNLKAVCKAAGGELKSIVKLTIYVTDLGKFPQVNEIMGQFFAEPYPARATIQVSALPKNSQLEIDAVMVL